MKNKKIMIIVAIICSFIALWGAYKFVLIKKYPNGNGYLLLYYKNPITIKTKEQKKTVSYENMKYKNVFNGYVWSDETNNYVKYDKKKNPISVYSLEYRTLYLSILNENTFNLGIMDLTDQNKTDKHMLKFLKNNNINDDFDLIKYVKANHPLRSNIFTSSNQIKNNYIINLFANVALSNIKSVTPIEGDLYGYMVDFMDATNKEIHLINGETQYIINLNGSDLTSNDFIVSFLETISFE